MYLVKKSVRTQLIRFTNDLIYQKQTEIIDRILRSSYAKVENIAKEKLYSVLNHDIEAISGGINAIPTLLRTETAACSLYQLRGG